MGDVSITTQGRATVTFDDGVSFSFQTATLYSHSWANNPNWHYYDTSGIVHTHVPGPHGSTLGRYRMELVDVWQALKDYPALEFLDGESEEYGDPVTTGSLTDVDLFGPVYHIVNDQNMVLVNATTPQHTLHDGYVCRHPYPQGDHFVVQSIGFGTGVLGTPNELLAYQAWGNASMLPINQFARPRLYRPDRATFNGPV